MFVLYACPGNRVIATGMPGMTTSDTFQCQPKALESTMGFNCLDGILRTTGSITAMIAEQGA